MSGLVSTFVFFTLFVLWASVLTLYLRHRREAKRRDPLVAILLSLLALEAGKSTIENAYFGLLWGEKYGVLSHALSWMGNPGPLTSVKLLNVVVALVVLVRLIRVWVPTRLAERHSERMQLEDFVRVARESEERFRVAFQTTPDAMSIGRLRDGVNIAVNEGYCKLSGFTEAEAVGVTSITLNLWVDPAQRKLLFEGLRKDGFVRELPVAFRRKTGERFDAVCTSRVYSAGGEQYFLTVTRDISEQKRTERATAAIYRVAEAASNAATLQQLLGPVHQIVSGLMPAPNFYIALHDPARDRLEFPYYVDQRDPQTPAPQAPGKGLTEYVLRTGQPLLVNGQAAFDRLVAQGEVENIGTRAQSWLGVPLRTQQRTIGVIAAQIYTSGTPYDERDQALLQYVSTQVARAIEKLQGDEALRRSEHRFRALIENTSDGICLLDADGTIRYLSPAAEEMLGYSRGEPPGPISRYLHPEDAAAVLGKLSEALQKPGVPVMAQGRTRRSDGTVAVIEGVFTNLLAQAAVQGVVLNLRDLTERKQMEGRLMMADRMVSVGTLAAGVAHEINNPLAYVIANLEYVAGSLAPVAKVVGEEVVEALREAQGGAERVRVIVRDLKTFSRADDSGLGPVELHRVLDASCNMAWNEIRHRARLVKDYSSTLPLVRGNESRLGQVFLNLLINAAQAIAEGAPDRNVVRIGTRLQGGRIVVDISDTGAGIKAENLPRLFDPFFTTKPIGVGTGLGLFVCQNIVGSLGGEITVESKLGAGTTLHVALPLAEEKQAPAREDQGPSPLPPRKARILIIDDEPLVGTALRRRLSEHEVATETSALAALERLRRGEVFDLILCDVMMEELSGMGFLERLQAEVPEAVGGVVFMTGGAFTPAAQDFLARVRHPRLEKPVDLQRVRALLNDRLHQRDQEPARTHVLRS